MVGRVIDKSLGYKYNVEYCTIVVIYSFTVGVYRLLRRWQWWADPQTRLPIKRGIIIVTILQLLIKIQ